MTPQLIEALGHLSSLTAAELAVVSATATTLAATSSARAQPVCEIPSWSPRAEPPVPRITHPHMTHHKAAEIGEGRLDLLATKSWSDGIAIDTALFASDAYRARLSATVPTLFYIAGADGLRRMADLIGRTVFKPGVTEGSTVALRLSSLAASRYGACVQVNGAWVEEQGFDHFEAVALPLQRRRGRGSPVQPALRAIAIDRPASMPLAVLDRAVRVELAKASLTAFADSADATTLCQQQGIEPALLQRYTPGPRGAGTSLRHRRATELAIIGPRADADRIADMIERVIADYVMA